MAKSKKNTRLAQRSEFWAEQIDDFGEGRSIVSEIIVTDEPLDVPEVPSRAFGDPIKPSFEVHRIIELYSSYARLMIQKAERNGITKYGAHKSQLLPKSDPRQLRDKDGIPFVVDPTKKIKRKDGPEWQRRWNYAHDIRAKVDTLQRAIKTGNAQHCALVAMELERAFLRAHLSFREPDAKYGREQRAIRKKAGDITGAITAAAAKRKQYANSRLNQAYEPVGRDIHEHDTVEGIAKDVKRKFGKPIKPSTAKRYVRKPRKQL